MAYETREGGSTQEKKTVTQQEEKRRRKWYGVDSGVITAHTLHMRYARAHFDYFSVVPPTWADLGSRIPTTHRDFYEFGWSRMGRWPARSRIGLGSQPVMTDGPTVRLVGACASGFPDALLYMIAPSTLAASEVLFEEA